MNEGVIRRVTRFGMRGERVGEASNPGPRYFFRRRSSFRGDTNDEDSANATVVPMRDPETFQPNVNGNRFAPLASRRRPASRHRSRGAGVIVATQVDSDTDADEKVAGSNPWPTRALSLRHDCGVGV